MGLSRLQIGAIAGALLLGVLIFLAPHQRETKAEAVVVADLTPDQQIDSAIALVTGANPMAGIRLLREVLTEDSNNLRAHFELGKFSIQSGQYAKARERFKRVLEIDPTFAEAYPHLAQVAIIEEDTAEAIQYFEQYKAAQPDSMVRREVQTYIDELKGTK